MKEIQGQHINDSVQSVSQSNKQTKPNSRKTKTKERKFIWVCMFGIFLLDLDMPHSGLVLRTEMHLLTALRIQYGR